MLDNGAGLCALTAGQVVGQVGQQTCSRRSVEHQGPLTSGDSFMQVLSLLRSKNQIPNHAVHETRAPEPGAATVLDAVCCKDCARSSTDRAFDYGSKGWGFESLRARAGQRPVTIG